MNNFKYRIGLDIGIASVGWSVIEHNENDDPCRIIDLGVRTFSPAENPKDGSSLAVDRRMARGNRRRLRRRAFRIEKARDFLSKNLLDNKEISKEHNLDIYELRKKGLDELLSIEELYYIVIHFVKHRGFRSNRKSETESEAGKVKKAIINSQSKLENYRSIGEMIATCSDYFDIRTNTNGKEYKEYFVRNHSTYDNCFLRDDLKNELLLILHNQAKLGNAKITEDFINNVVDIFYNQRNFDDGPNAPSPYKANFNVGYCTFEPEEKRAPKASFSFEYFNALQKINHLSYSSDGVHKCLLTMDEKKKVIERLYKNGKVDYGTIRKLIGLSIEYKFMNLSYKQKKSSEEDSKKLSEEELVKTIEKKVLCDFVNTNKIAKVLSIPISKENKDLFNVISIILSMRKSDSARINLLKNNRQDDLFDTEKISKNLVLSLNNPILTDEVIDKLIEINVEQFGNLSLKAIDKITPYLEEGLTYDKACEKAGYNFNTKAYEKKKKIEWIDLTEKGTNELQEITSPVVLRSVSQTIKVINAIVDKYGSPCAIYIELAREMAMNKAERNKADKQMKGRAIDNEKIIEKLKSLGIPCPSGQDIVKYRLYEEQNGKSAYSTKSFTSVIGDDLAEIFKNNNTQIDHIMPYSKCFDDSFNNKVLVLSNENQEKGNRVPREYITNDEQWKIFESFVNSGKFSPRKKQRLLMQSSNIDQNEDLNQRALNDTKQASKFILNVINNHLLFEDSSLSKKPVIAVNGSITSFLRKIWGISKIRFASSKHHAVDACVIACTNDRTIQKITKFEQFKSYERAKEKNCLQDDNNNHFINKLTGEIINKSDYNSYFKQWEEEFNDIQNKKSLVLPPYPQFTQELQLRILDNVKNETNIKELMNLGYDYDEIDNVKPIFVSKMTTRKLLGPIHKETIRSSKYYTKSNPKLVSKTAIENLKLNKDGEIENYAKHAKQNDPVLYNALKAQLIKFNGDGKSAFAEPFYKPCKDQNGNSKLGNQVKKVQTEEVKSDFVVLDEKSYKVAEKSSMVRIDIFKKDGKNYIVPIYVSDVYKQQLPNIAVPYKNQRIMNDEDFAFSLYPNDLVYLEKYNKAICGKFAKSESEDSEKPVEIKSGYLYYISTDISSGACNFVNHDSSIEFRSVGFQNIDIIEKYTVNILGEYHKVGREKRMPLHFKKKK